MTKQADILSKYIEALTKDMSDEQAQFFANSWAECMEPHSEMVTKQDLRESIKTLESDLKIFFVYLVGGTLFIGLFLPIIQKYLHLI